MTKAMSMRDIIAWTESEVLQQCDCLDKCSTFLIVKIFADSGKEGNN